MFCVFTTENFTLVETTATRNTVWNAWKPTVAGIVNQEWEGFQSRGGGVMRSSIFSIFDSCQLLKSICMFEIQKKKKEILRFVLKTLIKLGFSPSM